MKRDRDDRATGRRWAAAVLLGALAGAPLAIAGDRRAAPATPVSPLLEAAPDRCTPPFPAPRSTGPAAQRGILSYYADRFHGRRSASGVRYDRRLLTAAHRTLPFLTMVKVTNLANGRSVLVRVTDRGPHVEGRVLDVSHAAARALGMLERGLVRGLVEVVPDGPAPSATLTADAAHR